jgi:hypothetical protein
VIHVVRCHHLVEEGPIAKACEQLADAANRLDGEPRPEIGDSSGIVARSDKYGSVKSEPMRE